MDGHLRSASGMGTVGNLGSGNSYEVVIIWYSLPAVGEMEMAGKVSG